MNYDQRALAKRSLKHYDDAIVDYTTEIEKNPTYEQAYARRGYTYALMQQYEKAVVDYQAALKIKPDDYETVQRLQYAQGRIADRNAPPPTPAPPPEKGIGMFWWIIIIVTIGAFAATIWRMVTRGKPDVTSNRIR
jgi:tetratricopeptide (TPR) repeat protein